MSKTWFFGDIHFGQRNILGFKDNNGKLLRPFNSIEEHDETIIQNINKVVKPEDRLYLLGDIAIGRQHIAKVGLLNGRKKLIKGNHDIFKLKDYTPYFDDIVAYRVYPDARMIVSHIPVHDGQLRYRFKYNVHGHLHANVTTKKHWLWNKYIPDTRYLNLCPEKTNFMPLEFGEVMEILTKTNN